MSAGWIAMAVICALVGQTKDCRTLASGTPTSRAECEVAVAVTLATVANLPGPIAFTADARCIPSRRPVPDDAPEDPGQPV